jgi:hypothetical protein
MPITNTSNLSSVQRVKYEDYKGAPAWFEQFLNTLNLFMTAQYNMSNKGINYSNLGVIQPFTFSYTPGVTQNFNFANPIIQAPTNVIIGNVYIGNNFQSHPATVTQLYWHFAQGFIFVDDIIGLTNGVAYTISVQVS